MLYVSADSKVNGEKKEVEEEVGGGSADDRQLPTKTGVAHIELCARLVSGLWIRDSRRCRSDRPRSGRNLGVV